jgi:hypothetical protein
MADGQAFRNQPAVAVNGYFQRAQLCQVVLWTRNKFAFDPNLDRDSAIPGKARWAEFGLKRCDLTFGTNLRSRGNRNANCDHAPNTKQSYHLLH